MHTLEKGVARPQLAGVVGREAEGGALQDRLRLLQPIDLELTVPRACGEVHRDEVAAWCGGLESGKHCLQLLLLPRTILLGRSHLALLVTHGTLQFGDAVLEEFDLAVRLIREGLVKRLGLLLGSLCGQPILLDVLLDEREDRDNALALRLLAAVRLLPSRRRRRGRLSSRDLWELPHGNATPLLQEPRGSLVEVLKYSDGPSHSCGRISIVAIGALPLCPL
mmetsp:Transcript_115934/g.247764  ORF Transcript_115934/g.247764 Transcript_115934/m.247764 type:complete len:222 (+) Transcript_115934:63-728(+)